MNKKPSSLKSQSAEAVLDLNRKSWDESALKDIQNYFRLPNVLKEELLTLAYRKWDHQRGVENLLRFWLLLSDTACSGTTRTPRYVFRDKRARLKILERLSALKTDCLVMDMYTFYQRKNSLGEGTCSSYHCYDKVKTRLTLDEEEFDCLYKTLSSTSLSLSLSSLILPNVANATLLHLVIRQCRNLKNLNVNFSVNIDDEAIFKAFEDPYSIRNLKTFFADGTFLTSASLRTIFQSQPFLERLLVDERIFEDFLLNFNGSETLPLKRISFSVKRDNYGHSYYLGIVATACPFLEDVNIEFLHRSQISGLEYLKNLEYLNKLAIGYVGYPKLGPILSNIGPRLSHFKYSYYGEENPPYFHNILHLLPNLEHLSIHAQILRFSPYEGLFLPTDLPLKSIRLNIHALIPKELWISVMIYCRSLTILELTTCAGLNDDSLISEVLNPHPSAIKRLKVLSFRGRNCGDVKLTEKSIEKLYERCLALDKLEDTSTWSLSPCSCFIKNPKIKKRF